MPSVKSVWMSFALFAVLNGLVALVLFVAFLDPIGLEHLEDPQKQDWGVALVAGAALMINAVVAWLCRSREGGPTLPPAARRAAGPRCSGPERASDTTLPTAARRAAGPRCSGPEHSKASLVGAVAVVVWAVVLGVFTVRLITGHDIPFDTSTWRATRPLEMARGLVASDHLIDMTMASAIELLGPGVARPEIEGYAYVTSHPYCTLFVFGRSDRVWRVAISCD